MGVRFFKGVNESDQQCSVQNGTLQGVGDDLAMTIETFVSVPSCVMSKGQDEVVAYLEALLGGIAGVEFEVTIGKSVDAVSNSEDC